MDEAIAGEGGALDTLKKAGSSAPDEKIRGAAQSRAYAAMEAAGNAKEALEWMRDLGPKRVISDDEINQRIREWNRVAREMDAEDQVVEEIE